MSDFTEEQFERKLAGLAPTEPSGSIVDAAYEAGRRDVLAERAGTSFPVLKIAAALVVSMGLAGVGGFVVGRDERSPSLAAQPVVSPSTAPEMERGLEVEMDEPAPRVDRPVLALTPWAPSRRGASASPFSILAMRTAVLTPEGIMLDRLPSGIGSGGGSGSGVWEWTGAPEGEREILTPRMRSIRGGHLDL